MAGVKAELSSMQTALEEIELRVRRITDELSRDPSDTVSVHLIAVERALASAIRGIAKAQKSA
jgi:hypothetical protein